jgi:hypothetical protein
MRDFNKLIHSIERECHLGVCELDEHIFRLRSDSIMERRW